MSSQLRTHLDGEAHGAALSSSEVMGTITSGGDGERLPVDRHSLTKRCFCWDNSVFHVFSPVWHKGDVSRGCVVLQAQADAIPGIFCFVAHAAWGSFCPTASGMFFPVPPLLSFRKKNILSMLQRHAFRIFEVLLASVGAFFDLAMSEMRAGSEATCLLYVDGCFLSFSRDSVCCHPQLTSSKLKLLSCHLFPQHFEWKSSLINILGKKKKSAGPSKNYKFCQGNSDLEQIWSLCNWDLKYSRASRAQ